MKKRSSPRREIFVLTPGEKRAVAFTVATFLLGLGTMHYRAAHPRPPAPLTEKEQRELKRVERRQQRERGESTARPRRKAAPKTSSPAPEQD
jgi:hypothetical protein